jgi:hypothetical protein
MWCPHSEQAVVFAAIDDAVAELAAVASLVSAA